MNSNFAVIGFTRLGIKPESAAPAVDAFTTRPSKLEVELTNDFRWNRSGEVGGRSKPFRIDLERAQLRPGVYELLGADFVVENPGIHRIET